jgi:hypothetical protein
MPTILTFSSTLTFIMPTNVTSVDYLVVGGGGGGGGGGALVGPTSYNGANGGSGIVILKIN